MKIFNTKKEVIFEDAVEYVVEKSRTIDDLMTKPRDLRRFLYKEIEKHARERYIKIRAENAGRPFECILAEWNVDQREMAAAMQDYLFSNAPKLAEKIFKSGNELFSYLMLMTICAFDQEFDILDEMKKAGKK